MKKLAKVLAVVLTMAFLVTGITLVASATDEAFEITDATGATVTQETPITDLAEAIAAAGEGGTVKLLANYNYTAQSDLTVAHSVKLNLNGKTITMKDYTVTENEAQVTKDAKILVNAGVTLTVENGIFSKTAHNDTVSYAVVVSGENAVVNFINVKYNTDCPLASVTDGATFNAKGSYNNERWSARRRNFYIVDATVNIEDIDINAQYNPPIVVDDGTTGSVLNIKNSKISTGNSMMSFGEGAHVINIEGSTLLTNGFGGTYQTVMTGISYDDRITITDSEIRSRKEIITMVSGADYESDNALAEGEYNIKVVRSLLAVEVENNTYIIKSTPYITQKNDSSWLYWSLDGETAYHWVEVTLPEGTTETDWLAGATDVEVTQDSRNAEMTQTLPSRRAEEGKYYELIPELPYRHTELYFEDSYLISQSKLVHTTSPLTTKNDDGSAVIRNDAYYKSERHSMINMEFDGCLVEVKENAYEAYSSTTVLRNTVTVFSGIGAAPGAGIHSNGRFEAHDSAFIYPMQEAKSATTYHRMFNSGASRQNFWLENTYISDHSNNGSNHGYSNSLSLYGNTGVVVDVNNEAPDFEKIEATVAEINKRFEKNITLPTQSKFFVQDFEDVVGFGGDMNWVIPGVKVEGATAELTDALTLTATAGTENALYFGHYNTNYHVAALHGATSLAQYQSNYYEKLGYPTKATAFDDLSLIGIYVIDFDITSTAPTAIGLVAEDGTVAATLPIPTAADGLHVTVVTNTAKNRAILYLDGYYSAEISGALGEATVLLGAKLALTEGTATVDNLEINHYAKDYTDADELFDAVFTPDLDAWEEGFARVPAAPAPEETTDVTVRWYLNADKTDYIDVTYKSNEEFVLTDEMLTAAGKTLVKETEQYYSYPTTNSDGTAFLKANAGANFDFVNNGVKVEAPYYIDNKGNVVYKDSVEEYDATSGATWNDYIAQSVELRKTVLNGWSEETLEDGTIAYVPKYVGGIAKVTNVSTGAVTYYESFNDFVFSGVYNAKTNIKVELMSDIVAPLLSASNYWEKGAMGFYIQGGVAVDFDLAGHDIFWWKINPETPTLATPTLFRLNPGATLDLYSSAEGSELVVYQTLIDVQGTGAGTNVYIGVEVDGMGNVAQKGYNIAVSSRQIYAPGNSVNDSTRNKLYACGLDHTSPGGGISIRVAAASTDVYMKDCSISALGGQRFITNTSTATGDTANTYVFDGCYFERMDDNAAGSDLFDKAYTAKIDFVGCSFKRVNLKATSASTATISFAGCRFDGDTAPVADTSLGLEFGEGLTADPVSKELEYTYYNQRTQDDIGLKMNPIYRTMYGFGAETEPVIIHNKTNSATDAKMFVAFPHTRTFSSTKVFDSTNATTPTVKVTITWHDGSTTIVAKGTTVSYPSPIEVGYELSKNNFVATEDETITIKKVPNVTLYHNLVLAESFVYNIYLPVESNVTGVTFNGVEYTLDVDAEGVTTTTLEDGTRCYVLSVEMKPQNIGASLTLNLVGDGYDVTNQLSALDYVELMLADSNEAAVKLGKAILAYAKAACDAFEAAPAEVDGYAEISALVVANPIGVHIPEGEVKTNLADVKEYVTGAALKLDSTMKFRFYLAGKDTNATFTYTYGGETVTYSTQQGILVSEAGDRYYVELELNAYEFAQDITITAGGVTVSYNLMTYANSEAGVGNGALLRAIATYSVAAKNYKAAE